VTGVLVDAEADGAGLQERGGELMLVGVLEEVAEDGFDFGRSAFLQVAEHRRGELRVFGGD
jgi:hypothetical protein